VLELSKIEAGRTTLQPTTFDLHRLLLDVQDMFALKAEKKGLQLLFEQQTDVPRIVCADDVKLRQILINLLNNAVKFTTKGGVVVRVGSQQLAVGSGQSTVGSEQWAVSSQQLEDYRGETKIAHCSLPTVDCPLPTANLLFEVEDSGPGIAPEEIDTLFEAFGQTESGRQTKEGTGLGLPISRKFVQLMGGDMRVESQVGHGTLFMFEIQVEMPEGIEGTESVPDFSTRHVIGLEPGQPRYRILIVDDSRRNRQLVVKLLSDFSSPNLGSPRSGFDLREAENGQEAIEVWQAWNPHLIWMDMRMPAMDGYEATKEIRRLETGLPVQSRRQRLEPQGLEPGGSGSNDQFPMSSFQFQTKIIALTASAFEEERLEILEIGCDDYLRKPFRDTELFELMSKHIGVKFVYEEDSQGAESKEQVANEEGLTPEALAALPAEWLETLAQASVRADLSLLFEVIEKIHGYDARLADALAQLAEDFEYDEILALIQGTRKGGME